MSKIRLEKQRRLTLPPEIVAQAGLQQDDVLDATYEGGDIILRPPRIGTSKRHEQSIMAYAGTCQGAWGDTLRGMELHLAQDRASWDR